jgi:hypothetical protein
VALFFFAIHSTGAGKPTTKNQTAPSLRQKFLMMFARCYYPGRSGQIMLVPREGEVMTGPDAAYRFMHGSPWEYDTRIPLLFYGSPFVRPGQYRVPASQQDVAPTLAETLRLRLPGTVTGRPLQLALNRSAVTPGVIFLAVLDGMRADYLDRYAPQLPTLNRLRQRGAWFPEALVNFLPTITPIAHASIGTGTDPRIHGIVGAFFFDHVRQQQVEAYAEMSLRNLMTLTLADAWNLQTDGKSVILSQGGLFYALPGLAGHGACTLNARPIVLFAYNRSNGRWETNPECYRLPEYLRDQTPQPLWQSVQGRWLGHDIADARSFCRSALFSRFEGDALAAMIEREPLGADEITDLLFVNLKATDFVGHQYGPDSPEIRETLSVLDRQLARCLELLDRKVGRNRYLVAITADHGMPPEPESRGHQRHAPSEIIELIHRRFDPQGQRLVKLYEASSNQLYLDRKRLEELETTLSQVKEFMEKQPFVFAAYTEDEVRSVRLPVRPDVSD